MAVKIETRTPHQPNMVSESKCLVDPKKIERLRAQIFEFYQIPPTELRRTYPPLSLADTQGFFGDFDLSKLGKIEEEMTAL